MQCKAGTTAPRAAASVVAVALGAALSLTAAACGDDDAAGDGGVGTTDAGVTDAGEALDASGRDATTAGDGGGLDSSTGSDDAGIEGDAGATDGGETTAFIPLVAAGWHHACATREDGSVVCWGDNHAGQLGDGTTTDRTTPVTVTGLTDVVELVAGGYHTCARTATGAVYCWGEGSEGQLGDRRWTDATTPSELSALSRFDVTGMAAGGGNVIVDADWADSGITCFLIADGTIRCTGANHSGQLGNGRTMSQNAPVEVEVLPAAAVAVTTGSTHACAILEDASVWCWGDTGYGQSVGGTLGASEAWRMPTLDGALAIEATGAQTCVVLPGSNVVCWGGDIRREPPRMIVEDAPTLSVPTVEGIGVGAVHACAVASTGELSCWGDNGRGQLGDPAVSFLDAPGPAVLTDAEAVATGLAFNVAVRSDGSLVAWGENTHGQLGDGTTEDRTVPVDVMF